LIPPVLPLLRIVSATTFCSHVITAAIAVPPLDEQREIVHRAATLFKLADTVEKRPTAATIRTEKLMQAILGKASCNEIVPTEACSAGPNGRWH
jgi:hypothetical protein